MQEGGLQRPALAIERSHLGSVGGRHGQCRQQIQGRFTLTGRRVRLQTDAAHFQALSTVGHVERHARLTELPLGGGCDRTHRRERRRRQLLAGFDRAVKLCEPGPLLGIGIALRNRLRDQSQCRLKDRPGFARQGRGAVRTRLGEAVLVCTQGMAGEDLDAVARQQRRARALEGVDHAAGVRGAVPHQGRRTPWLQSVERVVHRLARGRDRFARSLIGGVHRGRLARHHLQHQLEQRREQHPASVLVLGHRFEPLVELLPAKTALEHRTGHGRDGEVFGETVQQRGQHSKHGPVVNKRVGSYRAGRQMPRADWTASKAPRLAGSADEHSM